MNPAYFKAVVQSDGWVDTTDRCWRVSVDCWDPATMDVPTREILWFNTWRGAMCHWQHIYERLCGND